MTLSHFAHVPPTSQRVLPPTPKPRRQRMDREEGAEKAQCRLRPDGIFLLAVCGLGSCGATHQSSKRGSAQSMPLRWTEVVSCLGPCRSHRASGAGTKGPGGLQASTDLGQGGGNVGVGTHSSMWPGWRPNHRPTVTQCYPIIEQINLDVSPQFW